MTDALRCTFTKASSRIALLARDAHDLAMHCRALERHVADAMDLPACQRAREAALQLEGLADLLNEEEHHATPDPR